jgi:PAS domain S-box-containing protein
MPTINAHRTFEPPTMPSLPDFERRRSITPSLSHNSDSLGGLQSPPLRSRSSRPKSAKFSSYRLRSNSGLSLHTNEDILRQYTDYHPDGTPRAGLYSNGGGQWSAERLRSIDSVASSSRSQRSSIAYTESDSSGELPIPDLVGREMFDMVMADHAASGQLWKFAADRGVGQNVDYLMKIRDYIQSLEQVVIQLSTISTSYTSITATSPLGLPPPMSKALNTNIKHLTTSLIPSLENMFLESKAFIEQRIVREIFPDFVKQQLSQCTSLALSLDAEGDSPLNPYPGLKGSFCLSDPSRSGNPITFASDEFEELTGYSRTEVLAHNCRFLQGPQTDRDRIANMRSAIWRNDECTELLLNFRKDGTPFWNLLFLCPLLDKTGKTKFFMGAQIDVSSSIHDTDDVLKVLSYGAMEEERATERCSSRWASEASHDEPEHDEAFGIKNNQLKTSKKATSFFKSFKKANPPPPSPPLSPRRSSDRPRSSSHVSDKTYSTRSVIRRFSSQPEMLMSTYARYMILEHVPSYPKSLGAMPLDQEGKYPPKLCVSFYSKEMSDALDLGPSTEAVIGKDIFDIMTEQATLPSVTKAFKLTVRDLVVRDGKSVSLDLALANHIPRRANTSRSPVTGSDSADGHKKPAKLMSHWTPLKDVEGHVKYVVMIVSPI